MKEATCSTSGRQQNPSKSGNGKRRGNVVKKSPKDGFRPTLPKRKRTLGSSSAAMLEEHETEVKRQQQEVQIGKQYFLIELKKLLKERMLLQTKMDIDQMREILYDMWTKEKEETQMVYLEKLQMLLDDISVEEEQDMEWNVRKVFTGIGLIEACQNLEPDWYTMFSSMPVRQSALKSLTDALIRAKIASFSYLPSTTLTSAQTKNPIALQSTMQGTSIMEIGAPFASTSTYSMTAHGTAASVNALDLLFGEGSASSMCTPIMQQPSHMQKPSSNITKRGKGVFSILKSDILDGPLMLESKMYNTQDIIGVRFDERWRRAICTTRILLHPNSSLFRIYQAWIKELQATLEKTGAVEKVYQEK